MLCSNFVTPQKVSTKILHAMYLFNLTLEIEELAIDPFSASMEELEAVAS